MKVELNPENMGLLECFSSRTRVEILRILAQNPCNIKELAEQLHISPAIVTRHVGMMEAAGLIRSVFTSSVRGRQKVCQLAEKEVTILLCPFDAQNAVHKETLRMGQYRGVKISFPCGLINEKGRIGVADDPRYFQIPDRSGVYELWFAGGYLDYVFEAAPLADAGELHVDFQIMAEGYRGEAIEGAVLVLLNDMPVTQVPLPAQKAFQPVHLVISEKGVWLNDARNGDLSIRQLPVSTNGELSVKLGFEKTLWPDLVLRLREVEEGNGVSVGLYK